MCVASSFREGMESKVNIGNKDFLGIFGETRFNGPEYRSNLNIVKYSMVATVKYQVPIFL